jgi:hypothetical protein
VVHGKASQALTWGAFLFSGRVLASPLRLFLPQGGSPLINVR